MTNWWGSIRESIAQIKEPAHAGRDIFLVAIIVLVALTAFGLGRLSAMETSRPAVTLTNRAVSSEQPMYIGGLVVASRKGRKYHFPWCPGAQHMKEANKVWFASEEDARAAGYTPAGNCKGLGK